MSEIFEDFLFFCTRHAEDSTFLQLTELSEKVLGTTTEVPDLFRLLLDCKNILQNVDFENNHPKFIWLRLGLVANIVRKSLVTASVEEIYFVSSGLSLILDKTAEKKMNEPQFQQELSQLISDSNFLCFLMTLTFKKCTAYKQNFYFKKLIKKN